MNIWLCPVKPKNWRTAKTNKLFGVPKRGLKIFRQVQTDDLLVFHVLKPAGGIVSICRVTSEIFEDHQDIWGKDRYPFRVRIELQEFIRDEDKPIPLSHLFGKTDNEITIEPYLRHVGITKISQEQFKKLKELFKQDT